MKLSKYVAAALIAALSNAAQANFSGSYAISNWVSEPQIFGCGSSTVDTSGAPASVAFTVPAGCGSIFAQLRYASFPQSAKITFDYSIVNATGLIGFYAVGGTGVEFLTGLAGAQAGSVPSFIVRAGQELKIGLSKNAGGGTSTLTISNFTVAPIPTVQSVSPTIASGNGGTAITISGLDFTGATSVTVGGAACASVTIVSATTITCTAPPGSGGIKSVVVSNADGSSEGNSLLSYTTPTPTLTEWALLMFGALLLGLLAWQQRANNEA